MSDRPDAKFWEVIVALNDFLYFATELEKNARWYSLSRKKSLERYAERSSDPGARHDAELRKRIANLVPMFWSYWERLRSALTGVPDDIETDIARLIGQGWRERMLLSVDHLAEWHYWTRPADVPNAAMPDLHALFAKCERGELPEWGEPILSLAPLATIPFQIEGLRIGTAGPEGDVGRVRPRTRRERQYTWLAEAMLLVNEHPEWPDAEIARRVDIDKSRLTRTPEYQAAAAMARGTKGSKPEGHITVDSERGLRDVDGVAQDKPDRGEPISDSNLFREYCCECGEPIRVPKDQIGKNPRCEDCL